MSWAKLSDDFGDDCWTLSDAAFRLHTEALVWNGRKLLDCHIPEDDLRRFGKHPDAVSELLDVGWWERGDDGDFVIRHHAQYQRTREAVVNQQAVNATNGAKGGRPKKPREQASQIRPRTRRTESVSESVSESQTDSGGKSHGEARSERDRTGQAAPTQARGARSFAGSKSCLHGMVNGQEPDPWLGGRAACPECAAEMKNGTA